MNPSSSGCVLKTLECAEFSSGSTHNTVKYLPFIVQTPFYVISIVSTELLFNVISGFCNLPTECF